MAIPVYLTLEDEDGKIVKGASEVSGREGTIEILELMHCVILPTDDQTGAITGARIHTPYAVMKELDCRSPFLNRCVTSGRRLSKATLDFYAINDNGQEQLYFKTVLEGLRISAIDRFFHDYKDPGLAQYGHLEYLELAYEKISWQFMDGNIIHSDSWNERSTYTIEAPHYNPKTGKYSLRLIPDAANVMCGRSAFLIHGDSNANPGKASNGCIIASCCFLCRKL